MNPKVGFSFVNKPHNCQIWVKTMRLKKSEIWENREIWDIWEIRDLRDQRSERSEIWEIKDLRDQRSERSRDRHDGKFASFWKAERFWFGTDRQRTLVILELLLWPKNQEQFWNPLDYQICPCWWWKIVIIKVKDIAQFLYMHS